MAISEVKMKFRVLRTEIVNNTGMTTAGAQPQPGDRLQVTAMPTDPAGAAAATGGTVTGTGGQQQFNIHDLSKAGFFVPGEEIEVTFAKPAAA